jgi:hypothetical protein
MVTYRKHDELRRSTLRLHVSDYFFFAHAANRFLRRETNVNHKKLWSFIFLSIALTLPASQRSLAQEESESKHSIAPPAMSEGFSNMVAEDFSEKALVEYSKQLDALREFNSRVLRGTSDVRRKRDYLEPLRREIQTINEWLVAAIQNDPAHVTELIQERDDRIAVVWDEFRQNRRAEYDAVRVTKSDYQHASRDAVNTPGGTRGKTERTCTVETPADEYELDSARKVIESQMNDTHVGDVEYMPHGQGCTLYIYAKALSFGNSERSRVGVTLYGVFKLRASYKTASIAEDEAWLRERING